MTLLQILNSSNLEEIKAFIQEKPLLIKDYDWDGTPYSFYLAQRGDLELLRWVVEYSRADLESLNDLGQSILYPAIASGNLSSVKYLVEQAGLSSRSADRNGLSVLEYAKDLGEEEIYNYLSEISGITLEESFKNPIIRGFSPDPSIVRVGEDYYMVNSSFVHFPGIPISHSKDLVHWKTIGHALNDASQLNFQDFDSGRGIWAADISYHKGRFYIVATLRRNDTETPMRRQLVVDSDKPEGPYSAPRFIEEDGIDPSLFSDGERRYMLLNRGNRIMEVDEHVTRKLSPATLLYYGDTKKATEAPHLLKKDQYYYLFMAEGGTGQGHHVNVARSQRLHGPYEPCPYNPILKQTESTALIQRAGHGKVVDTPDGRWFMVYLGARQYAPSLSQFGRESFLAPVVWTEDGWPIVGDRRRPSLINPLPHPEITPEDLSEERGFAQDSLPLCWYFIRNIYEDDYHVQDGILHIRSSEHMPNHPEAYPILLQRLREPRTQATLAFSLPETKGNKKGMLLYYDEHTWMYFYVEKHSAAYFPAVEIQAGENHTLEKGRPFTSEQSVKLAVEIDFSHYVFKFENMGEVFTYQVDTNILQDEGVSIGKRFTGPGIGIFSFGKKEDFGSYEKFSIEEEM